MPKGTGTVQAYRVRILPNRELHFIFLGLVPDYDKPEDAMVKLKDDLPATVRTWERPTVSELWPMQGYKLSLSEKGELQIDFIGTTTIVFDTPETAIGKLKAGTGAMIHVLDRVMVAELWKESKLES